MVPVCSYYNETLEIWETRGCWVVADLSDENSTVCACSHLTNFAVLLADEPQESKVSTASVARKKRVRPCLVALFPSYAA